MVSSNGVLEKRLSTSKLALIQLESILETSYPNKNESWTVKSLTIKGDKTGTKIADKMDRNARQLSMIGLCT